MNPMTIARLTVPAGHTTTQVEFSKHCMAIAYISHRGGQFFVHYPTGGPHPCDSACDLAISRKGELAACRVRHRGWAYTEVNGTRSRGFAWTSAPVIRPDGAEVAYWGSERGAFPWQDRYHAIFGGVSAGVSDVPGPLGYHPIGQDPIFSISTSNKSRLLIGRNSGPEFDFVHHPTFHPVDGSTWYWGRNLDKYTLMRNETAVDESDDIPPTGPYFGACPPHHVAYWIKKGDAWNARVNGRTIATTDVLIESLANITPGPDGSYAFAEKFAHGMRYNINGVEGEAFDAVGPIATSRGFTKTAYLARKGDRQFVVVDGVKGPSFDATRPDEGDCSDYLEDFPVLSGDGKHLAYIEHVGDRERIVLDGPPLVDFAVISDQPAFIDGSNALVYGGLARAGGEEYLVADEESHGPYDRIWSPAQPIHYNARWQPNTSPGSFSIAFGALQRDELLGMSLSLS